ncbi:hypothetical protein [Nocardia iowensis]|uniref:Uncharacterized protein n=1 Tax=Nocardia iowensis TaxID=204891 RepID=A0ABX8RZE4_NOCIO|nr:hypothetical protein [Nocardia iowensis]QXN94347.1 hypothetical protein KV110_15585 [Nocardia iowensis]
MVTVAAALFVPIQLASAGAAAAQTSTAVASTGSAEIPPSCVGKIDPIQFYIQSLFGTQPRHCL